MCLLEAKQLQGLGDSSVLEALKMWTKDLESHQPGLLWVTALSPEAGKLGPCLVRVCNKAVVPGGRP